MTQRLVIKQADLVIAPTRDNHDVRSVLQTLPHGKGAVFSLLSIEHKEDLARERVAHILSSHLEHLAADLAQETNVVRRFEQGISRMNRDLARAARELSVRLQDFQAIVGVVAQGQVFMSGIGELRAIFLHKTAERRYAIYELDAQFRDDQNQSWDKPFVAVLDGEMHPGDIFYIATPVSHQILSMDELQDILVTLPPAGALQRIQQFLPATEPYGAVAFHAMEDDKTGVIRKANPINSLQELEHTKERTATVLGEKPTDILSNVKEAATNLRKKLASPGMRGTQTTLKRALGMFIKVATAVATGVTAVVMSLAGALNRSLQTSRTSKAMKHGVSQRSHGRGRTFLSQAARSFNDIKRSRKLALLTFMFVMVLVGGVVFLRGGNKEQAKTEANFTTSVADIETKILAAQASLIYKNTAEAQKTLQEAASAVEALPRDTSEHTSEADRLAQELATLQAKVRGVTLLVPTDMANLRTTEPTANLLTTTATVNGIFAIADNLGVYKLDAINHTWQPQTLTTGPMSRVKSSATLGGDIIAIDATQQLGRINLATLTFDPVTSGTNLMPSVNDIATYNDALYALTATGQQLVKMRAQGPNFEAGTNWIDVHTTDLSTARAVAIDSDVYILLDNKIVKFTSGREQDWKTAVIDPPLTQATDIWTAFESKYLYVLDPAEKRVLVIAKDTGAVQAQYVADGFADAIGLVVQEAISKVTVITPTQALEFTPVF